MSPKFVVHALLLLGSVVAHAAPSAETLKASIDEVVARNFANRTQVGVVVGVIQGNETYLWSYGERVLGEPEPTGQTFFEIGSITKTFTGTLLALEVLRGRVKLDDPIQTLWPELKGRAAGLITLEQLATHTSGLPRLPGNFHPADPSNPYKDYDLRLLTEFLLSYEGAPGPHSYDYSNLGMGLLGYLLATKLNGQPFEPYLRENLTAPLSLHDTKITLTSADLGRAAHGYGNFLNPIPFWELNILESAGALKATANDLLGYVRFHLKDDSSLLHRAAELARAPRAQADGDTRIGLGWFSTTIGRHSVHTHGGATGGFRSSLIFDRENQLGVVVLSNTDMQPECIAAPVFGVECSVPDWSSAKEEDQNRWIGSYRSDSLNLNLRFFVERGFLGLDQDGTRVRLFGGAERTYVLPDAGALIRFNINDQGEAIGFTLFQGGQTYEFLREPDFEETSCPL